MTVSEFIKKELEDLDVSERSQGYLTVFENAMEASDIMSKKELKCYIEDYVDSLPMYML